jgi:hypothetical protein
MMNMLTTECSNALGEEDQDRHPGAGDATDRGGGCHRHHHAEADHPVAQDRLDEHGEQAGGAEMRIADGLHLGDLANAVGDAGGFHLSSHGQRYDKQTAVEHAADQIAGGRPRTSW